jgi:hypothetical protein
MPHTATDIQTTFGTKKERKQEAHTIKDYEELSIYFKQRREH